MKTKTGKALLLSLYTVALYYLFYNTFAYYIEHHNSYNLSSSLILAVAGLVTIPFVLYPFSFTSKPSGKGTTSKWEGALWLIITVILAVVLNVILTRIPSLINDDLYKSSFAQITGGGFWHTVIATCIVSPVLEEIVFRGVVFGQMKEAFGTVVGVIVSAACFGIVHHNMAQLIYAAIMGVVLATMYHRMKRLYFPMIAHALANLAVLMMTYFL